MGTAARPSYYRQACANLALAERTDQPSLFTLTEPQPV